MLGDINPDPAVCLGSWVPHHCITAWCSQSSRTGESSHGLWNSTCKQLAHGEGQAERRPLAAHMRLEPRASCLLVGTELTAEGAAQGSLCPGIPNHVSPAALGIPHTVPSASSYGVRLPETWLISGVTATARGWCVFSSMAGRPWRVDVSGGSGWEDL